MPSTHLADLLLGSLERVENLQALEDQNGASFRAADVLNAALSLRIPLGISSAAVDTEHEASSVLRAVSCVLQGVAYVPVIPGESLPVASASHRLAHGARGSARRKVGNIAYLLRTSGTTGTPKFIVQGYEEAGHHALVYTGSIRLTPGDRIALLASLTTDASLMDMFGGLISGATVCMFDPRRKRWAGLADWVRERSITVLHMTPTLLRLAFESETGKNTSSVRAVVLGGEPATGADLHLMRSAFRSGILIINGYGPSECTTALQWRDTGREFEPEHQLPLGSPVGGTQAKTSDGELLIAGPGLFWGYHGRDDLNDQCFTSDSLGTRWYRTGDVVSSEGDELFWSSRRDGRHKVKGTFRDAGELGRSMKGDSYAS